MPFFLEAVREALATAKPTILYSDQGNHFTSPQYIELLVGASVQINMDGKGQALVNIITECFWRTLKYEEVYLHEYESPRHARTRITEFIREYNHTRPHQSLDDQYPATVYHENQDSTPLSSAVV